MKRDAAAVAVVQAAPGRFEIRGDLNFGTARRAYEAGVRAFAAGADQDIDVDCGTVGSADSAGLAVLIEWLAWARRAGRGMRFSNLPAAIRAVANISAVQALVEQGVAAR